MKHSFSVQITNVDSVVYKGDAVHCRVWTEVGSMGLKARQEPVLVILEKGSPIEIKETDGGIRAFTAADGVLRFKDNACTILLG